MMPFHEQILIRMYDHEIIGMKYKSSIMVKLENAGYVTSHGKSGGVYSLTELGVFYVRGLNA